MSDILKQTIRLVKRTRVSTDDRGRSVWTDPVESAELELVSTTMLKRVLESDDDVRKRKIRELAEGEDGVLAVSTDSDDFEVISDSDLQAILDAVPQGLDAIKSADVIYEPVTEPDDAGDNELSLVSTQALRRILKVEDDAPEVEDDLHEQGFNPYDKN